MKCVRDRATLRRLLTFIRDEPSCGIVCMETKWQWPMMCASIYMVMDHHWTIRLFLIFMVNGNYLNSMKEICNLF